MYVCKSILVNEGNNGGYMYKGNLTLSTMLHREFVDCDAIIHINIH